MVQGQTEKINAPGSAPFSLRLRFQKRGMLQYISHLDLLRTMEHVVVRAGLPLRYSEGFNPHVRLSFGMPLSVGAESITEYMDVQLTREVDPQWAKSQLNAQLPQELSVLSAAAAVHRFSEIAFACYALELRCAATTQADAEKINALWNNPLIVEKRTKKGIVPTDISPMIRTARVHAAETGLYAEVLLSASSASYLNPDYLLRAAAAALGIAYDDPEALTPVILRTGVYLSDTVTPFC